MAEDLDAKQIALIAYGSGKKIADVVTDVTGKLYSKLFKSAKTQGGRAIARNALIYAGSFSAAQMTFLTLQKDTKDVDSKVIAALEVELQQRLHKTIMDFCEKITTKCVTISFEVPRESL